MAALTARRRAARTAAAATGVASRLADQTTWWAEQLVALDGTRPPIWRTEATGTGPPVVCIAPFHELNVMYTGLITALREDFVVAVYAPRVSAIEPFGPIERAAELECVREQLDADGLHLVAWSDAGSVALAYLAAWPARVRSVVLIGYPGHYRLPKGLSLLAKAIRHAGVHRLVPAALSASVIAWCMAAPSVPAATIYQPIRALGNVSGYLRYSILPCFDPPLVRCAVVRPSLLLVPTTDRISRPNDYRRLADQLQTAPVERQGGDHFMPFSDEAWVAATVRDFLLERV